MIIATQDNKIKSWDLVIADTTHNHLPSLLGTHLIYRQFTCTDEVKELIISQICIGASSKQVIATIRSDTNKKNLLVKLKDVYNKYVTKRQKYLNPLIPVQALIVKLHRKHN